MKEYTPTDIQTAIRQLYEANLPIHVSVSLVRPRVQRENAEAVIIGIYPHLFRVQDISGETPKNYTIPYTDVISGHIRIAELEQ